MRLIDVDALLKDFTAQTPFGCGTVGIKFVDDLIKNQPTAYDVEAVVAELEKRADDNDRCADRLSRIEGKKKIREWRARAQAFRDCAEIVRGKE